MKAIINQSSIGRSSSFSITCFTCGAFFHKQICLQRILFDKKILAVGHLISVSSLVYRFIGIENDSNLNTH